MRSSNLGFKHNLIPISKIKGEVKYVGSRIALIKAILRDWEPFLSLSNRYIYHRSIDKPFSYVGLMLSRICLANCNFCPQSQKHGIGNKQPYMSFEVAKKIVDDLAEHRFTGQINFGENGDALLNPHFRDIINYVNIKLPSARSILFTNMMNMDSSTSEFLLKNNLSSLFLNVDGASANTYECAKPGLDFDVIQSNLHNFISIRNRLKSNCQINIQVLPPVRYLELREDKKNNKYPYDVPDIIKYWSKYLSSADSINEIIYFYNWNNKSNEIRQRSCPPWTVISGFFNGLLISTEGDTYLCCLDYNTKLTYGNVLQHSIYDLWRSERRRQAINDIVHKRFNNVGEPCLHCNEKSDYLKCYLNYLKHRYF